MAYKIINELNTNIYDKIIINNNNYNTPEDFNDFEPYSFTPYVNLFGSNINIFTNIFSNNIYYVLDTIMIKWLDNLIFKTDKWKTFLHDKKKDYNSNFYNEKYEKTTPFYARLNMIKQPIIILNKYTSRGSEYNNICKIHMTVKLENLFWVIEKLIKNINLFKIDSEYEDIINI